MEIEKIFEILNNPIIDDDIKSYFIFKMLLIDDSIFKKDIFNNLNIKSHILLSSIVKSFYTISNKNIEKYNDTLSHYKNIINSTIELSSYFTITNSLELSNLYTYLLWNGYYSYNKKNYYSMNGRKVILGLYSYDIFLSKGVCLNYADMLADLLNEYGFSSAVFLNKSNNSTFAVKYKPKFEANIIKPNIITTLTSFFTNPIINRLGNHAYTLIEDNNNYYIYDPTNITIFNIIDQFNARNVNGLGNSDINPFISYGVNIDNRRIDLLDRFMLNTEFNPIYDKDFFNNMFDSMSLDFMFNTSLFDEFYNDIQSDIIYIKKRI